MYSISGHLNHCNRLLEGVNGGLITELNSVLLEF